MDWKLTRSPDGAPEIVVLSDAAELVFGRSMLAEVARDNPQMHRLSEGRYIAEKQRPGREV